MLDWVKLERHKKTVTGEVNESIMKSKNMIFDALKEENLNLKIGRTIVTG